MDIYVSGREATLTAIADQGIDYPAEDFPWMFTNERTNFTITALGASACSGWTNLTGKLTIPSTLKTVGNSAFNSCKKLSGLSIEEGVSALPYRSFYSPGGLRGPLIFPHSMTSLGSQSFLWISTAVTSVWIKGPEKVSSGTQPYTDIACGYGNIIYVSGNLGLKAALFGWYTKPSGVNAFVLHKLNKCPVYLPRNGRWLEENLSSQFGGTGTILFYGPGEELDISIDETRNVLTATPTTVHALTNVLASAAIFKSDFGLDTKVSLTNAFTFSASVFTGSAAQNVTFERLYFAVQTQAQLASILTAMPSIVPLAIDPTGLTETLTIPGNREVEVKFGEGYKVRKRLNGFEVVVNKTAHR